MDRYDNLTLLGQSKVGPAYRALDRTTNEPVIVKILSEEAPFPLHASIAAQMAPQVAALWGFNISRLVEMTQFSEGPAIVSEYVSGPSILQFPEKGKVGSKFALDVANQLINALCDGERMRMVHGDLKPSNVLLGAQPDGRPHVRVTDWGLASARSEPAPESLLFMAPERLGGAQASPRADLFSAGAVLFYLCTGMSLVNGRSVEEVHEAWKKAAPDHLKKIRKDLAPKLVKFILGLLEMKPEKRPATPSAAAKELAELNPPPLPQPAGRAAVQSGSNRPASGLISRPGAGPGQPAIALARPQVQPIPVVPLTPQPRQPVQPLHPEPLALSAADLVAEDSHDHPGARPAETTRQVAVVPLRPPPEVAAKLNLPPMAEPPPQVYVTSSESPAQYQPSYGGGGTNPQQGHPANVPYGSDTQPFVTGGRQATPVGARTQQFNTASYQQGSARRGPPPPAKSKLPLIFLLLISFLTLGGGGWWLYTNWGKLTKKDQETKEAVPSTNDLAEKLRNAGK